MSHRRGRTAAFLDRFSRQQHDTASKPHLGTRRAPNQQNTFSASEDFLYNVQKGQRSVDRMQREEEREAAMFHVRNLIKGRNNMLRQVMNKHRYNKTMQAQLKQAQKRHNGVLLHVLQTSTPKAGGLHVLINQLGQAHSSHAEVVTSMAKHGGATPLSVIDFVGTLNESHDALCALAHSLTVLWDDGVTSGTSSAQPQYSQQHSQQQSQQPHLSQQDGSSYRSKDIMNRHTQEAHADLTAAHKVHSLLMQEMTKKHALHHIVANELHTSQSKHHQVMTELLLNPSNRDLRHVTSDMKVEHDQHAALLLEIIHKHQLHHVIKNDILNVHHSNGLVVENIAERSEDVGQEINIKRHEEIAASRAAAAGGGVAGSDQKEGGGSSTKNDSGGTTMNGHEETAFAVMIDEKNLELAAEKEKVKTTQSELEKVKKEMDLLGVDKKRIEKHVEELHVELTATTEETNRLRTERLEILEKNKKEMMDLQMKIEKMESTHERNSSEIIALRTTIADQLNAMSTLTSGAREAVVNATFQTDAMNDEIGRLKQDLILAKQYKLHTVMEKVTKAGLNEQKRLQRIIAHMQAEKLALQNVLQQTEGERDGAFNDVRRLSTTMETTMNGILPNARMTPLEKQMSNPIAVKEQYTAALEQIRVERDALEQHRHELDRREENMQKKENEMVLTHEKNEWDAHAHRLAVVDESERLAKESRARINKFENVKHDVLCIRPEEEHFSSRRNAQKAHDLIMSDIAKEHQLQHVVVAEIDMVQRQHHQALEELHALHDEVSISKAVQELQNDHGKRIEDVLQHHNVHDSAANQIRNVHKHHHDLMHDLSLKQKSLTSGKAYIEAAPTKPKARGNMHDSVSQVHSIVMEDIMNKHRLNHVVVGEMRIIQRSHENVMSELIRQGGDTVASNVSSAQNQHCNLMREIVERHGVPAAAATELDAIHTHHHSLAYNLVHREESSGGFENRTDNTGTGTVNTTSTTSTATNMNGTTTLAAAITANITASASSTRSKRDTKDYHVDHHHIPRTFSSILNEIQEDHEQPSTRQFPVMNNSNGRARSPNGKGSGRIEAIHHVHALVMEEVLMKHNVHPEAVNELCKEQERHKNVISELRLADSRKLKHVGDMTSGTFDIFRIFLFVSFVGLLACYSSFLK